MSQKFFLGDRVYINKLSPMQRHFSQECEAIVMYSYAESYGYGNEDQLGLYILPNRGESSWYYANDLTLIEPDRLDLLPKSHIARKNFDAKQARDRDLVVWLNQGAREKELVVDL